MLWERERIIFMSLLRHPDVGTFQLLEESLVDKEVNPEPLIFTYYQPNDLKEMIDYLIDLIDLNGMTTHQGLFYA